MSSYLSDNDDDLFDYDPSVEEVITPSDPRPAHHDAAELNGSEKEFIQTVKNALPSDIDADLDDETGKINLNISHIYSSFEEAIHGFVYSFGRDHQTKSVHLTLDALTEGRFSLMNMFYFYEMRIARKVALVGLFGSIFVDDEETVSPFLHEISRLLKFNFTTLYYRATFRSTISILNHSLTVDRLIYRYLAEKLDMPVRDLLVDDITQYNSDKIDQEMRHIELRGFHDDLQQQMFTAFFQGSSSERQTLGDVLSGTFNAPATYLNSYQTMQGGQCATNENDSQK